MAFHLGCPTKTNEKWTFYRFKHFLLLLEETTEVKTYALKKFNFSSRPLKSIYLLYSPSDRLTRRLNASAKPHLIRKDWLKFALLNTCWPAKNSWRVLNYIYLIIFFVLMQMVVNSCGAIIFYFFQGHAKYIKKKIIIISPKNYLFLYILLIQVTYTSLYVTDIIFLYNKNIYTKLNLKLVYFLREYIQ